MKKLYISCYLKIVLSHRGTSLLFNGYTGAIDEVSDELAGILRRGIESTGHLSNEFLDQFSESEIKFLMSRGHITEFDREAEISELNLFVDEFDKYKRSRTAESASLILVPTYNCNLACPYCFEQDVRCGQNRKKAMTVEQVDRIFTRLLDKLFPTVKDKSKIKVEFYGGEPFLASNREVIERILTYTQKNEMKVIAISNGTQVHYMPEIFSDKRGLVNWVQVTFDGGKENHDKTRIGPDSKPTFERIIENIKLLLARKVRVDVRINCQKKTLPTIASLVERLREEGILDNPDVSCYAWPVHSNYIDKSCVDLSHKELSDYLRERGLLVEDSVYRWQEMLEKLIEATEGMPHQRISFCMKTKPNIFVYDPFNNLYQCLDEGARLDKRVGYVDEEDNLVLTEEYHRSQKRIVSKIEECRGCPLTLLCAGDCPSEAERYKGTIFAAGCTSMQECFDDALRGLYERKFGSHAGAEAVVHEIS